jgi:uncharacterized protein (TIGR03086 family)
MTQLDTNSTTVPAAGTTRGGRGLDPRPAFAAAIALARDTIAKVRPDQFTAPTPCHDFDTRALIGHMLFALRRTSAVAAGDAMEGQTPVITGVPDDGWLPLWDDAARRALAAFADDTMLDHLLVLPWTTLPGRAVVCIYTSELTVHTWDLANATGQHPAFDDDVVQLAFDTMHTALPAEPRGGDIPFAPPVAVDLGAPLINQLIGWVGRRP